MGTSTIVYTSLPDTDSTCSSYGLPSLPSGWTYNCETTTTYTNVDGTGWLPVNFTSMSFSSPLARLPVDPVNNATSSKYYTYVTGGSWELSAVMEAVSNKLGGDNDRVSGDGGEYADIYETGTNLELLPVNRNPNLVGYWKFDEGTGTNAYDASGNGNDGTLVNSPTWTTDAKKGDYALEFNGIDNYVSLGNIRTLDPGTGDYTWSGWLKFGGFTGTYREIWYANACGGVHGFGFILNNSSNWMYYEIYGPVGGRQSKNISSADYLNEWHLWTFVITPSDHKVKIFVDGELKSTGNFDNWGDIASVSTLIIGSHGTIYYYDGLIDDVRIYNRALSAEEVEAMYNSY